MKNAPNEKFVVYWLGYHQNPPAIQSLPQRIDVVNGKPEYLLMIRPGDIVASEDLAKAYASGYVKTVEVLDEKTGAYVHQVQLKNQETGEYEAPRKALMPWISEDS